MAREALDHGGDLDHHIDSFGGERSEWIDLSTGINNSSYPIPKIPGWIWGRLPDKSLISDFEISARNFWKVPKNAEIISANGTSLIISILPSIYNNGNVEIYHPTYNEYEAAFTRNGWKISKNTPDARVLVNPNNPDGKIWTPDDILSGDKLTIIDESFCDLTPDKSLIKSCDKPGVIILKSFGKFWGLAGLRFGCAIALPETLENLKTALGPWPASGPALYIASKALKNKSWIRNNIKKLNKDMAKLDNILAKNDITILGGTSLFRLFQTTNAENLKKHFAKSRILIRTFPYSNHVARIGVPSTANHRSRIENALREFVS